MKPSCISRHHELMLTLLVSPILAFSMVVIDTSANYMGGKSEELVGKVVRQAFGEAGMNNAVIVTKFGYTSASFQGQPGVVTAAPGLCHSMQPDFMHSELEQSLRRLGTDSVDVYLVHNPEHHLTRHLQRPLTTSGREKEGGAEVQGRGILDEGEVRELRGDFYGKVTALFEAMEERVDTGQVMAYGVSSAGLSLPKSDLAHVSWEKLVGCAEEAAARRGKPSHSFRVVQMPANLLEVVGLSEAPAMEAAGLQVMACHPLNASMGQSTYHLVDDALRGGLPHDYMDVCRNVLEHFTMEVPEGRELTEQESDIIQGCRFIQQLVQDMNSQLVNFTSFQHYEAELAGSITPILNDKFEGMDEASADILQLFFERYGAMVRFSCAQHTRSMVMTGKGCPSGTHDLPEALPLQQYAVRWVARQPGVACTVVDMESPEHVKDALLALS
ncbi:unnamed protein product [Discosporangium mesarthrocarpum]